MRYLLLAFCLAASAAQAGIYKTYDKNGNVIFSDVPSQEGVAVEDKPVMTVPALSPQRIKETLTPVGTGTTPAANTEPSSYKITIGKPAANENIQHGAPAFKTDIKLEPALWKTHHLLVMLDGTQIGRDNLYTPLDPAKLDRGQHRLELQIVNQRNKVLGTESVDFMVMQPSGLNNKQVVPSKSQSVPSVPAVPMSPTKPTKAK